MPGAAAPAGAPEHRASVVAAPKGAAIDHDGVASVVNVLAIHHQFSCPAISASARAMLA